jgi:hypothetical protein
MRSLDTHLISEDDTVRWLSRGGLKTETECEITAPKDHATKILQTEADSNGRLGQQWDKRPPYISMPILAKEQ